MNIINLSATVTPGRVLLRQIDYGDGEMHLNFSVQLLVCIYSISDIKKAHAVFKYT